MPNETGANEVVELTAADIERIIGGIDDDGPASPTGTEDTETTQTTEDAPAAQPINETQAFAHRLKDATNKARNEERESIAKSLGYESYADMQKRREQDMLEEKGFDPAEVSPIVEQIVKERLAADPRMAELDAVRQQKATAFAKQQLADLSELTGDNYKSFADVPADVVELWKQNGDLSKSYLALHGAELVRKVRANTEGTASHGSTGHMGGPAAGTHSTGSANKRPLTAAEKDVWRTFNPSITDEELDKMTTDK